MFCNLVGQVMNYIFFLPSIRFIFLIFKPQRS
jgi:hypothetical protein